MSHPFKSIATFKFHKESEGGYYYVYDVANEGKMTHYLQCWCLVPMAAAGSLSVSAIIRLTEPAKDSLQDGLQHECYKHDYYDSAPRAFASRHPKVVHNADESGFYFFM